MKVSYTIADGYVGQSGRPHSCKVDDSDILNCETENELRTLIDDCIQDHFEQNIFPEAVDSRVDEVIEFWKEHKAEHDANT